ncbi:hypothetical protein EJB05_09141 [Eragrostis curvula]|uniref:WAP domain-containing protein n=1 Tax=Eragrostis curvula TaxID=38414 RepID=A0A5J9W5V3_9POAL|nr:hypothetical protein EJB05_09141 [Eragrostis curvula]
MAKSVQLALLLLSLVLLAHTATPARIGGEVTDGGNSKGESTSAMAASNMVVLNGRFTGCYENPLPTPSWVFCCIKDENCWTTLDACRSECG